LLYVIRASASLTSARKEHNRTTRLGLARCTIYTMAHGLYVVKHRVLRGFAPFYITPEVSKRCGNLERDWKSAARLQNFTKSSYGPNFWVWRWWMAVGFAIRMQTFLYFAI